MIGFFLEIDKFPGALTIVGGISAMLGFALLQKAERQRAAMKELEEVQAKEIEVVALTASIWKIDTGKPE